MRIVIFCLCVFFHLCASSQSFSVLQKNRVQLPNGWHLTPVGKQLPLGDLPLNLAVSPDKKYMAVTNNGESTQSIQLFDVQKEKELHGLLKENDRLKKEMQQVMDKEEVIYFHQMPWPH